MGDEGATEPGDFIAALNRLMAACGVDSLKMSDWGIGEAELDAIVGEVNDTPDEAPRLQDTQRGMGRGDCQTTIKDDRSGNGCCTYKLNPGLPTFVILFARLAGVLMDPASTLLLPLAIEFQIFEGKVEQLVR